jgi:aryl-alcohol dehydrogenase-like predicted oxidoreductase
MTPITERRQLGTTDIWISPIALGCWPIAGMSSTGLIEAESVATIEACFDLGINFVDTAYCYGEQGESEQLIRRALGHRRNEMVIATKGGIHWAPGRKQVIDGRPETLTRECDESLRRLGTDRVELLYLHAPDPTFPIAESAGALKDLLDAGKARSIGASNFSLEQLKEFATVCPIAAYQPCYNMLQREIEQSQLPWCIEHNVSVIVYWPLMKGLLAAKLPREHAFPTTDSRHKYPMFQGEEWQRNQDFVDALRPIAADVGHTVAELVINWTIHRTGITCALCGAKRPEQVRENAGAVGWCLNEQQNRRIDEAIEARGKPVLRNPV